MVLRLAADRNDHSNDDICWGFCSLLGNFYLLSANKKHYFMVEQIQSKILIPDFDLIIFKIIIFGPYQNWSQLETWYNRKQMLPAEQSWLLCSPECWLLISGIITIFIASLLLIITFHMLISKKFFKLYCFELSQHYGSCIRHYDKSNLCFNACKCKIYWAFLHHVCIFFVCLCSWPCFPMTHQIK